jgi:beta-lactamase regulating signal transducer with metallopeptidase domain
MTLLADLHPIALLVSERLVACLLAGTVLAACAALSLRLMSRQNARTKFALCFATLAGIAAVPLLGWWSTQAVAGAHNGAAPVVRLPEAWAVYVFAFWSLGASIALARIVFGLYRVRQMRRSCVPVDLTKMDETLQRTIKKFRSERRVELCTSDLVQVPTAVGFWRPVIALPAWCVRDLSPEELHTVVLHEFEHLRRFDDWTNFFQRTVGAVFFFHPAVWWLESRLSLEREMACDDAVLAVAPDPKRYARCLVSLAEKSYLRSGLALAQAAVSRMQQLTARVTQILDARRPRTTGIWKPAFSIVIAAAVAGGASMEVAPRLVAFQDVSFQNLALQSTALHDTALQDNASHNNGGLATSFAATPVVAAEAAGRSVDQQQPASAPKAVPTRWVVQKPFLAKPVHKPVPNRAQLPSNSAENSSPRLTEALQAVASDSNLASHGAENAVPAQMLVMVVHTEQRDEAGMVMWSVRVVRWIVFHPQPQNRVAGPQLPAKT